MATAGPTRQPAGLRRLATVCTAAAAVVATSGLLGWVVGRLHPLAWGSGYIPMAPSTALGFLLLSAVAACRQAGLCRRGKAQFCFAASALVILLSGLMLLARATGWDLAPEAWLSPNAGTLRGIPLGRMAPLTAIAFVLLGLGALGRSTALERRRWVAEAAGVPTALGLLCGLTVALGYAAGTPLQYGGGTIPMALPTALTFVLLAAAQLLQSASESWLRGRQGAPTSGERPWATRRAGQSLVVWGLVLITGLLLGGWAFLRREQRFERDQLNRQLVAIADLKAREIARWMDRRLSELKRVAEAGSFRADVAALLADPSDQHLRGRVRDWLTNWDSAAEHSTAALLLPTGQVLLAAGAAPPEAADELASHLAHLTLADGVQMLDLHREEHSAIHLGLLAPIEAPRGGRGKPIAAVARWLAAEDYLYPVLREWPVPSPTGESFLVRQDGEDVLFLSELLHLPGSALRLRRPLTDQRLPAAYVVCGGRDAIEGLDFRGAPVLAAGRFVPGTPWAVVAKVDQSEAYSGLARSSLAFAAVIGALLLAVGLGVSQVWWQRHSEVLQSELAAEQRGHALAERVAYLTRYANDIILLALPNGQIVEANERAQQSYGYDLPTLCELSLLDLCAPDAREDWRQRDESGSFADGAIFETTHQHADGSTFVAEASARAVELGGVTYTQCILRDLSERREAQEKQRKLEAQLAQAQRLETVGLLAGGVAHDFNNLLTVILGCSELALLELPAESPAREDLATVHETGQRARDLTRQLLAFSRKQVLELRVLELNDVVRDVDRMLRRVLGEDIELATSLDAHAGRVKADPFQLGQVLLNLCVNARDAMPGGGRLALETGTTELDQDASRTGVAAGPYAVLSVTDTGCGMDEQTQQQIFDPFFTTKERGRGTGLGLATVYGIAKQHGGDVHVDSEVGRGTTFRVYLPRVEDPLSPFERPAEGIVPGQGEVILLVEDDPAVRRVTAQMLTHLGYHVDAAESAEACLTGITRLDRVDLLLTDVVMPGLDGCQLYERLQQLRPGLRVLYMSGFTGTVLSQHGELDDGRRLLVKPFTEAALSRKVREALTQPTG